MTPSDVIPIPVKVLQDDSSHWYIIPNTMYEKWNEFMIKMDNEQNSEWEDQLQLDFEAEFNRYRTGGDINNIQLFAQL